LPKAKRWKGFFYADAEKREKELRDEDGDLGKYLKREKEPKEISVGFLQ
jgi:hypothetical protein